MIIPTAPDPVELTRLMDTLEVLVDLRANGATIHAARSLLVHIQAEIVRTLHSEAPHREWRARRYGVVKAVAKLDRLLHS